MNHAPRIYELIEALRPGIDDLDSETWTELRAALAEDPELQDRLRLVQQQDGVVRTAMHEVAVPADLAQRLLVRLAEQNARSDVLTAAPEPSATETVALPAGEPAQEPMKARFSRRSLAYLAAGALVLVAVTVAIWPRADRDESFASEEELRSLVQGLKNDPRLRDAKSWADSRDGMGLKSHPLDKDIRVSVKRWQKLSTKAAPSAAVYELVRKDGKTARLFVVNTTQTYGLRGTPFARLSVSGAREAGAWHRGGMLYVLIAYDDAQLTDFVQKSGLA